MKLYRFNGQDMPMCKIRELVKLSDTTIAKHIKAGRTTAAAMLTHNPRPNKPGPGSQFVIGKSSGFARAANSNMR